jgi:hypothetical protein
MRKMMFLVALTILGATQAKAGACATALASVYDVSGFSCTLNTNWTLSSFKVTDISVIGMPPVPTAGTPTDSQITITPLTVGGVGFTGTPTIPWVSGSVAADVEFQYVLTFTGNITSIFQSISGTIGSTGGSDLITDDYCPGGTTAPPPSQGDPACPGGGTQTFSTSLLFGSTTASNTDTTGFVSGIHSVSVLKDVNAGEPAGDTITSFTNCFNGTCAGTPPPPPVAEPSALLMLGSGLLGLALLSVRRRRIV